jgi:CheY-like chemotaxis protein
MNTILVVDDEADIRTLVALMLDTLGYAVDVAENGREALARVRQRRPDLILLDMKMPVMSGGEFAAEYGRSFPEPERAPVVVMTAADHASRRCQEIGASDFLAKPFSFDELMSVVQKHLPEARPGAGAEAG